jgi:hypothetical protein
MVVELFQKPVELPTLLHHLALNLGFNNGPADNTIALLLEINVVFANGQD